MQNPLSNKALIEWLEKRDPKERYTYSHSRGCMLYQYFRDKGFPVSIVYDRSWKDMRGDDHLLPDGWNMVALAVLQNDRTFGQALYRAKTYLPIE